MKYLFIVGSLFMAITSAISQTVKFQIIGSPCVNSKITFTDQTEGNITNWEWNFGDGTTSSSIQKSEHTYSATGSYVIKLTVTIGGNEYSQTEILNIRKSPVCKFSVDTVNFASFARTFTDKSTSDNTIAEYSWDFGNNEKLNTKEKIVQYKYGKEADFKVWHKVTDDVGCFDSISQTVSIKDIFIVPNVFTPNGDGINDQFIVSVNGVEKFTIEIFSRWGNLVFKRDGVNQIVWDGTMPDGSKLQTGTYFYIIKAKDSQKEYKPEKGHITIFCEKE